MFPNNSKLPKLPPVEIVPWQTCHPPPPLYYTGNPMRRACSPVLACVGVTLASRPLGSCLNLLMSAATDRPHKSPGCAPARTMSRVPHRHSQPYTTPCGLRPTWCPQNGC